MGMALLCCLLGHAGGQKDRLPPQMLGATTRQQKCRAQGLFLQGLSRLLCKGQEFWGSGNLYVKSALGVCGQCHEAG